MIEIHKSDGPKGPDASPEGYILLDLHPRDGKFKHACCDSIVTPVIPSSPNSERDERTRLRRAGPSSGERKLLALKHCPSVALIIANFAKPTPERPSLLKHSEVTTFFHEFGHAMHNLLGRVQMDGFAGCAVKRDFVEVPSQMFEEWMWDKDMLKLITSHYKTNEPLPDSTIDKMLELKKLVKGFRVHGQNAYSQLSLDLFKKGAQKNVDTIFRDIFVREAPYGYLDPSNHWYAAFGHLSSSGYASKYYGYMWAKVFSLDVFDTIKNQNGLLNSEVGKKLTADLLGRGGSVDPDHMLKSFLGREPSLDAFLKNVGV